MDFWLKRPWRRAGQLCKAGRLNLQVRPASTGMELCICIVNFLPELMLKRTAVATAMKSARALRRAIVLASSYRVPANRNYENSARSCASSEGSVHATRPIKQAAPNGPLTHAHPNRFRYPQWL